MDQHSHESPITDRAMRHKCPAVWLTSNVTEAQGGGSHTAVMPAAPISAARPASTAYQGGCGRCAHSQLKPYKMLGLILGPWSHAQRLHRRPWLYDGLASLQSD